MSAVSHVQVPTLEGDLIANVISMNLSGRFKGQEIKEISQSIIKHLVSTKNISIFFGQQASVRMTSLPDNCELVGSQRAMMIYDKRHLQANDEMQYRHFLRDLEMKGRLAKYYLPESNYSLCKMKSKVILDVSFIAMSWVTDETKDTLKCLNLLRKLLSFAANLCAIEEMPVIIGGTFRLSLEEIKQVVYNEFEGFRCYGYKTEKTKRVVRMCELFISCPPLKMEEVRPIVVGGKYDTSKPAPVQKWRNLEDAFYWDPVSAKMLLRSGTSSVMSPTSPRALSPAATGSAKNIGSRELMENDVMQANECPYVNPNHQRAAFDSAEDTLRLLLVESERIKELVSEAEIKSRQRLNIKTQSSVDGRASSDSTMFDTGSLQSSDRGQTDIRRCGSSSGGGDCRADENGILSEFHRKKQSTSDEDEEFHKLEQEVLGVVGPSSSQSQVSGISLETASKVGNILTIPTSRGGAGDKENGLVVLDSSTGTLAPSSPLRKMPSYIDLYDEELVETNKLCYMQ